MNKEKGHSGRGSRKGTDREGKIEDRTFGTR